MYVAINDRFACPRVRERERESPRNIAKPIKCLHKQMNPRKPMFSNAAFTAKQTTHQKLISFK